MSQFSNISKFEIESLIAIKEENCQLDDEYVRLLCSLAERHNYIRTNLQTSLELSQRAKSHAENLNYEYGYAMSLAQIGRCFLQFGKFQEAQNHISESLTIFRKLKDQNGEALALVYNSATLREFGNYFQSYTDLEQALEIFSLNYDLKGISQAFSELAKLSIALEDYDAAIEYYNKVLLVPEGIYNSCRSFNNLGFVHLKKNESEKALDYFYKSLNEASLVDDSYCISNSLMNIANLYYLQGKKDEAHSYYKQGLSIFERFGMPQDALFPLKDLAVLQIELEHYEAAISTFEKICGFANESENQCLHDESVIQIASTLRFLDRHEEGIAMLNTVLERYTETINHELIAKCYFAFSVIYEAQLKFDEALVQYKLFYAYHEASQKMDMRKLKLLSSKSKIEIFRSQKESKKLKDIEVASMYDELVDYTQKVEEAENTIQTLMQEIELWKSIIPACPQCHANKKTIESISQIKTGIETGVRFFKNDDVLSSIHSESENQLK